MNEPIYNYDEISDTLSISFFPGVKATGIELNDHILLRIDKEQKRVIGIILLDYSLLMQQADFGPRSFPLPGLANLSPDLRELVLDILRKPPVSDVLTLFTYWHTPSEAIPITALHALPLAPA
jgi:uncharacterized protein YuzE